MPTSHHNHDLLLYDGSCGLCHGFVRFVLPRDRQGRLHFAPLQGKLAARLLPPLGGDPQLLDTVWVIVDYAGQAPRALRQSDAVLHVLRYLRGWRWLAPLLRLVPRALREWCYRRVARVRYRLFGRRDACALPAPDQRARFLIDGDGT